MSSQNLCLPNSPFFLRQLMLRADFRYARRWSWYLCRSSNPAELDTVPRRTPARARNFLSDGNPSARRDRGQPLLPLGRFGGPLV